MSAISTDEALEKQIDSLLYYIPTGTTEGERHILRQAFVQAEDYAAIITPPPGSPRLLVGKKGSGKSAVVDFSLQMFKEAKIPALLIKPLEIVVPAFTPNQSSGELTRAYYDALVRAIARSIGQELSELVVGESRALYDEAVSSGDKDPGGFTKVLKLVTSLAKVLYSLDLSGLLPAASVQQRRKLEEAIQSNVSATDGAFFLFIDDTDQVGAPGTPGHLNRVWALILAARELASRLNRVRVIITLRDEVWRELAVEGTGQRDQWDHFINLVFHLNPKLKDVRDIFQKRLTLAGNKAGFPGTSPRYDLFFEGQLANMPMSEKMSSWADIITTRSRERPRDAIQLLNQLATEAKRSVSKITGDILAKVMPKYSRERASLLAQEFARECPALSEIVRSFSKVHYRHGSFTASSEDIRAHLKSLPGAFQIVLDGRALAAGTDEDAFRLWAFLYSIGLLYPRVSDNRESNGYRFIYPHEDAELVSKERWNDMQKALWEIHPCFRDYLIQVQSDERAQFGLPNKPPKRR